MITIFLVNIVLLIIGSIFSFLPVVDRIPDILGYDIDTAFVTGISAFHRFGQAFWPELDIFYGFLLIMGYYALKLILTFFLGHRTPGKK